MLLALKTEYVLPPVYVLTKSNIGPQPVLLSILTAPITCSSLAGLSVPIPTRPFASTVIRVVVAVPAVVEAMVKSGVLAGVETELEMESKA